MTPGVCRLQRRGSARLAGNIEPVHNLMSHPTGQMRGA